MIIKLGENFNELICHGREVEKEIRDKNPALYRRSGKKLENFFLEEKNALPPVTPLTIVLSIFLLLPVAVINTITLSELFISDRNNYGLRFGFTVATLIIYYMIPLIMMIHYIPRGHNIGLEVLKKLYIISLFLGVANCIYNIILYTQKGLNAHLVISVIIILSLYSVFKLINSPSFYIFVYFCRSKRIAKITYQWRESKKKT
ncbi:hypothetical protein [Brenneria tiliae]|uniref:Uncharacterized protein n=1 Tax=Brenneria tiliae TaxID=2914984 RepID=A0ABT0MS37_9GAMM|nr:hypothetical protein [Brenneria tiliae]MCL2892655.1 hypothetical protein [Brenneria tiliae]